MTRKRIDCNWQIAVRIITTKKSLHIVINKAIMVKEMMIRVMVMISCSGSSSDDDGS